MKWRRAIIILSFIAFSDWANAMRDPTEPPDWIVNPALAKSVSELQLTEIIGMPNGHSFAIINGKMLSEGEFIQGYIITKISPNVVYLKNANGSVSLPLLHENVKSATITDVDK